MTGSRSAQTLGVLMSAALVLGIVYLTFGEPLGISDAGHWNEAVKVK
jgi:hypothetical protein